MTYTQRLFAWRAGKDEVLPGDHIEVPLNMVLGNDITAPVAINEFRKLGVKKVFDNKKIALIPDHFTPNKDIESAELNKKVRDFAAEMDILHYYDIGRMGIEHCLLPEAGIVKPLDIIIGADSHTCTYGALGAFATGVGSTDMAVGMATGKAWFKVPAADKFVLSGSPGKWVGGKDIILHIIGLIGVDGATYKSMEFCGDGINNITMDDLFTIANMAIEAGAKNAFFKPTERTHKYYEDAVKQAGGVYAPHTAPDGFYDIPGDGNYEKVYTVFLPKVEMCIALPHSPQNVIPAREAKNIRIDQSIIGSCTNGRLSDLRIAADILKGKKIAKHVRCIVIPGTQKVYKDALKEGIIETFIDAGAAVSTPTCGPCLGGHMGILAAGERAVATTNRNFRGRMGDTSSEVYLSGPAVAAASAVAGEIACP